MITTAAQQIRSWLNSIANITKLLLPQHCQLCLQLTKGELPLCHCCRADIERFDYRQLDNLLLRPDIRKGLKNPQFDSLISFAPYGWPYDLWITGLKFRNHFNMAPLMAELLLSQLCQIYHHSKLNWPQVILPMPIHRYRQFKRGYNQAYLLAKPLAKALKIKLDSKALTRIRHTKAQTELNKKARQTNVKRAFNFSSQCQYQSVAIVDDVITTGATINEVCKTLKAAGVKHISVWTVCATPQK